MDTSCLSQTRWDQVVGTNPFLGRSDPSVSRCCASSFWQSPGWPAPPKGTKKSCPCIRPRLRRGSFSPPSLRGSPYKGHPWPLYGGTPSSLAACRSSLSPTTPFTLLKGRLESPDSFQSIKKLQTKPLYLSGISDYLPRQEAERRRCAGGREAGRRARSEGTGTSLREGAPSPAPGAAPEGGEFCEANRGRLVRMSGWPSLWLLSLGQARESDSPAGRNLNRQATRQSASTRCSKHLVQN